MSLGVLMLLEAHFPAMGGAERQVETLGQALLDAGHRVIVVVPRLDPAAPVGADTVGALPVWRIAYPGIRGVGTLVLLMKLGWLLWRWRARYDAIHVHIAHNMGAVAAVLGRWLGKPVVLKFSGWWEQERGCLRPGGGPGRRLALWMLRRASAVQAISTRIAGELAAHGFDPRRVRWLPNGVRTARFEGIRRDGDPRAVVFVGRLVPEKGLDTLLEAWARARRPEGWRLRLVGDGTLRAALQAQAVALAIAASVDFVGESREVERHLAEAAVGVLPSRFEGLSNTLLESMASGLPMVATRISGSEDLVKPGRNGWLCEVDDVAGLAEALSQAMALDPLQRRQMGDDARAEVLACASVPAVVRQLTALYAPEQA